MERGASGVQRRLWRFPPQASAFLISGALLFVLRPASAQQAQEPKQDFDKTSLSLRTALHYDPAVDAPLKKLVELYRAAGRMEELLGLYESHLAQYPQDAGAKLVLARLYAEIHDRRATGFLAQAVASHPDSPALAWQHARMLDEQHDPKALDEMARAVSSEKSAVRRAMWLGELMKAASRAGREELVLGSLRRSIEDGSMTPEQRLRWARQALGLKLMKCAAALQDHVDLSALGPDAALDSTVLRAELASADGRRADAVKLLDSVIAKLAPDHWRRRDVLMLRMDLSDAAGREAWVEALRTKWQNRSSRSEADALSFADALEASHRGREALALLHEAAAAFEGSRVVEQRLLDLWEREGVDADALAWIDGVLKKQPGRAEMRLRRVRWLFASNQSEAAEKSFVELLDSLAADQQVGIGVELSRWLRRRNQASEAGEVLSAVIARAPQRWDLRRELAEILFVQRRRDDAVKLLSEGPMDELAPDARMEIAQFLMSKQMWTEARTLIEPWVAKQPGSFDGQMLLAKILGKLGEDARAVEALEKARSLCDTAERHQAWLDHAADFAEAREQTAPWLEREAERLEKEPGDTANFDRWLALVQQAKARHLEDFALSLLKKLSVRGGAAEKQIEIERIRLDLFASDAKHSAETETGLRALLERDAAHRDDYRASLIQLYSRMQRGDLVVQVLADFDAAKCTEAASLRAVVPLLREQGMTAQALAGAEKLTRIEPGERAHWSQWLGLLAETGDEDHLRDALRTVAGKAGEWNLKPEVVEQLHAHLAASLWRRALAGTMKGGEESWSSARRATVDISAAETTTGQQSRWALWLDGFLSAKLKDAPALAATLAKLDKMEGAQWIVFPDGMEVSVEQGRRWLRELAKSGAVEAGLDAPSGASGPLPPLQFRWGFALDEGRTVTRTLAPRHTPFLIVCDDSLAMHVVDRRSGKLRWTAASGREGGASLAAGNGSAGRVLVRGSSLSFAGSSGGYFYRGGSQPALRMPMEVVADDSAVWRLSMNEIICSRLEDGLLLWKNDIGGARNASKSLAGPQPRLALAADRLIVWDQMQAKALAFDLKNGKLLWSTEVAMPPAPDPNLMNGSMAGYDPYAGLSSGVTVDGDTVLVFGKSAAMLDVADGSVRWRAGSGELPGFPLDLATVADGEISRAGPVPPQTLMLNLGFGISRNYVGGYSPFPGRAQGAGLRWAPANGVRTVLQGYGSAAMLHRSAVWALGNGGMTVVSVMGLPVAQSVLSGTAVGFAGDMLVMASPQGVTVSGGRTVGPARTLFTPTSSPNSSNVQTADDSVAVGGSRVYAASADRLRCADARSGEVLFDLAYPADLAGWKKSMMPKPAVAQASGTGPYAIRSGFVRTSRASLACGTVLQDVNGGGTVICNTALTVSGDWIFPVSDRALACVSTSNTQASAAP